MGLRVALKTRWHGNLQKSLAALGALLGLLCITPVRFIAAGSLGGIRLSSPSASSLRDDLAPHQVSLGHGVGLQPRTGKYESNAIPLPMTGSQGFLPSCLSFLTPENLLPKPHSREPLLSFS